MQSLNQPISVDVFSDPACPWCLLGLARLDRAIAALGQGQAVEVRHHPFLLDADAPLEGEDVAAMLAEKYGRDPGPMWDRLEAEAQKSGIALDMRKQKMRYASQPAVILIMAAQHKGTQHPLARALGEAYYLDAKNIADPAVLAEIAGEYGFSQDEVFALITNADALRAVTEAAAHASAQGVTGVPFFVIGGEIALSGAQPETAFAEAFEKVEGAAGA